MNTILLSKRDSLGGAVTIPGSKSYTNRALLLAALTEGVVTIKNPLKSDDTQAMLRCLQVLGINAEETEDAIVVRGSYKDISAKHYDLNARLSGTTIRFLLPVLAFTPGTKTLQGEAGLNKRPIRDLVDALRTLGADITYTGEEGFPPLQICGVHPKHGLTCSVKGDTSSQYLSALLMSAPVCGGYSLTIGGALVSKPYVDMTVDIMKAFSGIAAYDADTQVYHVVPMQYDAREYTVEGDFSSAGYFFALAALTQSTIVVKNVRKDSLQPDKKILDVLAEMGACVVYGDNEITVTGSGVKPMSVDMLEFPDQAQTLAVLAAFASGKTILKNVHSLRVKETERVKALEGELAKMGIKTESTHDTLTIYGGSPHAASISTYGDHRMAMSFSVAAGVLDGMEIEDPHVVEKTVPEFFELLHQVGIDARSTQMRNISLIGMRGSGKTTIGTMIARYLVMPFVDTDSLIVEKNDSSIPDIVRTHGWNYFRDREAEVVHSIAAGHGQLIATGGGAILRPENVAALKKNSTVILLTAPVDVLVARIQGDTNRVALTSEKTLTDELTKVLTDRKHLYESTADFEVKTEGKTEQEVFKEILQLLATQL
ncbi:MAG: hypothetical protein RI911_922 [Candidatus Parcubacteria bacterium]|jgi:3-phosphoshikimate 1-carboxyvinyltransferase